MRAAQTCADGFRGIQCPVTLVVEHRTEYVLHTAACRTHTHRYKQPFAECALYIMTASDTHGALVRHTQRAPGRKRHSDGRSAREEKRALDSQSMSRAIKAYAATKFIKNVFF